MGNERHPEPVVAAMKLAGVQPRADGRFVGEGERGYVDEFLASYRRIHASDRAGRRVHSDSTAPATAACVERHAAPPAAPRARELPPRPCPDCENRIRGWGFALVLSLFMWGVIILLIRWAWA